MKTTNKSKIVRYILQKDNVIISGFSSISSVAKHLGITTAHITKQLAYSNKFSYKKITYELIDKLA